LNPIAGFHAYAGQALRRQNQEFPMLSTLKTPKIGQCEVDRVQPETPEATPGCRPVVDKQRLTGVAVIKKKFPPVLRAVVKGFFCRAAQGFST
jgi:hypothetical protein